MTNPHALLLVETALVRLERSIAALRRTIRSMRDQSAATASVEQAVPSSGTRVPIDVTPHGSFHPCGYWYRGVFRRCGSQIAVYLGVLKSLVAERPEVLPSVASALHGIGRSCRYVAETPEALFPSQSPQWARAHSAQLIDGWYVNTVLNLSQKKKLLRRIVAAAGLRIGDDVLVVWTRTQVRPGSPLAPTDAGPDRPLVGPH